MNLDSKSAPTTATVAKADDKEAPAAPVVNPVKAGDTAVTGTVEAGNPSATTTVTVGNVNVGGKEADNAKVPVLTPVVDPSNLTDAEKAKVAEEVKKANPTATDVKVNNDGSVATIAANKVVKEATKESSAQAPAKKAGAKELPNTGTKQFNASLGLALLAAVTGGLLISKKRKEEE